MSADAAPGAPAADSSLPMLQVGDWVVDREDGDARLLVVGHAVDVASSVDVNGDETVADVNPGYPENDWVVECIFPSRGDVGLEDATVYSYPRSRLQRVGTFHERDGSQEAGR
jgi:hypothetical protein